MTPVTMASPTAPASYAWEATDEEVAERYGVDPARIVRFDLNTNPYPPDVAVRRLAEGRFDRPISEYPPSDYRRLVAAAAAIYGVGRDEILVAAGADEVLDLCGKAFLAPGDVAVVPVPTYAMFRVVSEQRGATVRLIPRRGPADGFAIDVDGVRAAAREAAVVWLASPNNPTGLPEPAGAIEALLEGLAADALASGRDRPVVVLDEAYAEFTGESLVNLRARYHRLVVVRTASKAYGLAGLRVGFGIAVRSTLARIEPYRPPGSVAVPSVSVVADTLPDADSLARTIDRIATERERLARGLEELGWTPWPSVTNFLLVPFGAPEQAAAVAERLLAHGLVPRTFPSDHPLADHLRITVRTPADDDRLLDALIGIGGEP
jgi:histidinol-phosphate aminotransferase